ncbi:MAG: ATPase, partial [Thermodesulfobacteriota bacterium]
MNNKLLIGYVRSVKGLEVEVELNKNVEKMKFSVNGKIYRVGQIGSYVIIPIPFEKLVGIVSEVKMQPVEETQEGKLVLSDRKMMVLQLVGSIREGKFDRGLRTYPLIGDEVHLAHSEDINTIFAGQKTEFSINVGSFSQAENT